MLKVFYRLNALDFEKLMAVYEEGNLENAQEFFPHDTPAVQLQRAKESFEDYLRNDFFRVQGAFYAVWEEHTYVSALRMDPYQDGWLLEALETMPSCRKKGYATRLIAAVLALFPAGTHIYSHVGKNNKASKATHLRCGFQEILDYARYVDGTVTTFSCTMKTTV